MQFPRSPLNEFAILERSSTTIARVVSISNSRRPGASASDSSHFCSASAKIIIFTGRVPVCTSCSDCRRDHPCRRPGDGIGIAAKRRFAMPPILRRGYGRCRQGT